MLLKRFRLVSWGEGKKLDRIATEQDENDEEDENDENGENDENDENDEKMERERKKERDRERINEKIERSLQDLLLL